MQLCRMIDNADTVLDELQHGNTTDVSLILTMALVNNAIITGFAQLLVIIKQIRCLFIEQQTAHHALATADVSGLSTRHDSAIESGSKLLFY